MEDVLEVYQRPPDDSRPLVCLDEFAKQLLSETRAPIPATGRHVARHDYEYVREGSVSGFILAAPYLGGRDVFIGEDGPGPPRTSLPASTTSPTTFSRKRTRSSW